MTIREYGASDNPEADANRISMTYSMSEPAACELRETLTKRSRHTRILEEISEIAAAYASKFPEERAVPET